MKKIRTDILTAQTSRGAFSANLLGGSRGFSDAIAMETSSNDVAPTIKCLCGFTLIVEVG